MNKATRAITLLLGAAVITLAGAAVAGEGHDHGTANTAGQKAAAPAGHSHEMSMRHGGQVTMTKAHHFETVFAPDGIRVYLYTDGQAPMMVDAAKGAVTLKDKAGKTTAVPMVAQAPAAGEKTVYFCPMHAEVVQMEPGECAKCGGMKLFAQDRLYAKVDLSKVEPGTMEAAFNITGLEGTEPKVAFFESFGKPAGNDSQGKPGAYQGGAKSKETN